MPSDRYELPELIATTLEPLFTALPLDQAMASLTGENDERTDLVEPLITAPAFADKPALQAGLWLYVDQLERSHRISQNLDDATGAFWHGIMHRREGDFGNSHYWFRQAESHPVVRQIPDYEPHAFIDAVAAAEPTDPELLDLQRREWAALFAWCANR